MTFPLLSSGHWLVALASLLFVTCGAICRGQEYRPVVEHRWGGGDLPAVVPFDDGEGRESLAVSAVLSAVYDDNVYLRDKNKEGDLIFRASPLIGFTKGDAREGRGVFARIGYRPTGVVYASLHDENRLDHDLAVLSGWRGSKTSITWQGGLKKIGDAAPETLTPTDRLLASSELRAGWNPREKWKIEAAYGFDRMDYENPGYLDSEKRYGELALKYAYSPKTEVGIAAQMGRVSVDASPTQQSRAALLSLAWSPREKIRLGMKGGLEERKASAGSRTGPVLDLRVDWRPRERTGFFLRGYMRDEASVFYRGQNYQVRGISGGVTQQIGEKWTGGLEAGVEGNSYRSVDGGDDFDREDRFLYVRPTLSRKLSDDAELSFFYRYSTNSSTGGNLSYDANLFGVELNHRF